MITPKTKNGHSLFDISSLIQKALRRGDTPMALYSAREFLPKWTNYFWKRVLVVSAEDCHDMVTSKIIALSEKCENDTADKERYVLEAISILIDARKCRDADYFACNIFNSRERIELPSEYGTCDFDPCSTTKNGFNVFFLKEVLEKAINQADFDTAGYAANDIRVYYPNFCWDVLEATAKTFGNSSLTDEVAALRKADKRIKFDNQLVFMGKAIVIMIALAKGLSIEEYVDNQPHKSLTFFDCPEHCHLLPEYTYDCHTARGKAMGKNKRVFVREEQEALNPKCKGFFDNASWERFFFIEKHGWRGNNIIPPPEDYRVKEIDNSLHSPTLFML